MLRGGFITRVLHVLALKYSKKYYTVYIYISLSKLELFDCCAVDGDASAQASFIVDCLKWDSSGCICILDYYFLFKVDLWPILSSKNMCLSILILPTKLHNHWAFHAEVMAQNSYLWQKFKYLWPLTLSKFSQKLISSSTCHVVSLGQVWLKSVQEFSWNHVNKLKSHIFGPCSMTFDLWPWEILPKTNQRIYMSCTISGPSLIKISQGVLLESR